MRKRERVFAALAILGSFIGGVGLVCLSVFDTKRYASPHRIFLLVFILGVGISAIFTVIEVWSGAPTTTHADTPSCAPQYKWLSGDLVDVRKLRYAYIAKAIIATSLIVLSVAFTIGIYTNVDVGGDSSKPRSRAVLIDSPVSLPAVFEWIIAIGYSFYLLTFWYDLRLSKNEDAPTPERPSALEGKMRQVPPSSSVRV